MASVFELSYLKPQDEDFLKILWNPPDSESLKERMKNRVKVRDGNLIPSLVYFKAAWEQHLENLMQEWKTMNIISGLILPAASTLLQIDAAAADPVVRTTAVLALVCALISLLYGCLYITSFNLMKGVHKTYPWIILLNARHSRENVLWNAWIIVALPAIWLCWSIISFLICIVGFVWVAGTRDEVTEPTTTYRQALASRVVITVTVALGVIYFVLVIHSFLRYSRKDPDGQWRDEISAAPGYEASHQIASDDA